MHRILWNKKSKPIFFRILLYGVLFQLIFILFVYQKAQKPEESTFHEYDVTNNYMNVCSLPVYDFWHPKVMRFVDYDYDPNRNCDRDFKPFTELVNGSWNIVEEREGMNCSARIDDRHVNFKNWMKPGPVDCEFLEAVCWEGDQEVYGYLHSQIIPKQPSAPTTFSNTPNVFVFLLDSLSVGSAKRSLPTTLSLLTSRLEAVEFPFVNKVGDNSSMPSGMPLWFGKSVEKVNGKARGGVDVEVDWNEEQYCHSFLNNSILEEFRDHGYMTLHADDWAFQMVNYPNCKGFQKEPVHHYMHSFQFVSEKLGTNITRKHLTGYSCRRQTDPPYEYFQQFLDAYNDKPKFTWLWWNSYGHNYFNGFLKADEELAGLLEKNLETFENSFVILMGDHGFRLGRPEYMQTDIGELEVNNPYLSISIPKKLRKSQEILEILRQNSRKLQTHFDTRATLLDILKYQPSDSFPNKSLLEISGEKGHSYLRHQPSFPRTCGRLPIPPEYCICQIEKVTVEDDNLRNRFGKLFIGHIQDLLHNENFSSICEQLEFRETTGLLHFGHMNQSTTTNNYEITVTTKSPSSAHFRTVVTHNLETDDVSFGAVLRQDVYGRTGDCTNDSKFEKMCFCKDLPYTEKWKWVLVKKMEDWRRTLGGMIPSVVL